ncbi:hypothetical protein HRR83_005171 [Exophiala dermatitidis]|uniref:Uncharacterized protein n=1 Tax=Exophiala dermatitidis TaxID=5970 RepID=A0AAN6ETW9_EXODE|nr:hypothetical protein HRR74_005023 [Exophiala dermatitidis]KAJ4518727.1 hypothetical protein HRR73_004308 [Exophiala dermatitidis]KAJ4534243.1 hypothetical protein HRR76_006174 [Exophiala dermatitidis]KAJ4550397.1 hypothetical protein HRR77_003861 [Exophiala dermatitidis]KAJ4563524.1 hypothetical protein HRR79_006401 [Exophiala dermatitidis]
MAFSLIGLIIVTKGNNPTSRTVEVIWTRVRRDTSVQAWAMITFCAGNADSSRSFPTVSYSKCLSVVSLVMNQQYLLDTAILALAQRLSAISESDMEAVASQSIMQQERYPLQMKGLTPFTHDTNHLLFFATSAWNLGNRRPMPPFSLLNASH